jgi:hypothetical protein
MFAAHVIGHNRYGLMLQSNLYLVLLTPLLFSNTIVQNPNTLGVGNSTLSSSTVLFLVRRQCSRPL